MKIYFFAKDIRRGNWILGNLKDEEITDFKKLIQLVNNRLEYEGERPLSQKEIRWITREEVPDYDFYSIQICVDGFGNDTAVVANFKTYNEAVEYVRHNKFLSTYKSLIIVGQHWGEFNNKW